MTANAYDETRAVGRLMPNLDVEIVHRRAWGGEAEQLSVTLRGVPSFEAFGQFVESANPFAMWIGLVQAAWSPWLSLLGAAAPQRIAGPSHTASRLEKDPPRA